MDIETAKVGGGEEPQTQQAVQPTKKRRRAAGWDVAPQVEQQKQQEEQILLLQQQQQQQQQQILIAQQLAAAKVVAAQAAKLQQQQKQQQVAAASSKVEVVPPPNPEARIYIGALHFTDITANDIRSLFSPFGTITRVDMAMDTATGKTKGYCFVEFSDVSFRTAALVMDQFEFGGRKLKVSVPASQVAANPQLAALALEAKEKAKKEVAEALPLALVESRFMCVKNVHADLSIDDVRSIFSPFGSLRHCEFSPSQTALQSSSSSSSSSCSSSSSSSGGSAPVGTRIAFLSFTDIKMAKDAALSLEGFGIGGLNFGCELIESLPEGMKEEELFNAKKASSKKEREKEKEKKKLKVLILNMVTFEDAMEDPSLKREIAGEVETKYGELVDITFLFTGGKEPPKVLLEFAQAEDAKKACEGLEGRFFAGNQLKASLQ